MMKMNITERLEYALKMKRFYFGLFSAIQIIGLVVICLAIGPFPSLLGEEYIYAVIMIIVFIFSTTFFISKWRYFSKQIEEIYDRLEVDPKELDGLSGEQVLSFVNSVLSERDKSNDQMMRGHDEKGPDWGRSDAELGKELQRRDAIVHGVTYEGLEDEITIGEQLKREADDLYAKVAQQRWEETEANDPDLIEAGVERLGDLVTTDFFEKNAEEGAFKKVVGISDDEREDDR